MRKRALLSLALALTVAAPMAFAQDATEPGAAPDKPRAEGRMKRRGHKPGGKAHKHYNLKAIQKIPSLSADQKAELEKIQSELDTSTGPLREQLKAARADWKQRRKAAPPAAEGAEGGDKGPDLEARKAEKEKFRGIMEQIHSRRKAAYDKSIALLKDDQKAELDSVMAKMKEEHKNRRMNGKGEGKRGPKGGKHMRKGKGKRGGGNNLESVSNEAAPPADTAGGDAN